MTEYSAEDVRARWDDNAEFYAAICGTHGDVNKAVLLTPSVLEMLGDATGRRILDAGCGEGYLSRLLAAGGASVTAIDYSEKLLGIARERTPEDLNVTYRHANFETLEGLPGGAFDIVVSVAALQDLPDYRSAIAAAYRVLVPGGFFLLALLHPIFSADGGWVRDAEGKKLHWKVDNYFREHIREHPIFPESNTDLVQFQRTLTSYVRAVLEAGFAIEDLFEPYPSEDAVAQYPEYENDFRMSHYLILKLRKQRAA